MYTIITKNRMSNCYLSNFKMLTLATIDNAELLYTRRSTTISQIPKDIQSRDKR